MVKRWIQQAIHRPGKLHVDLGISKGVKIPMTLLNKIVNAKSGDIIQNPVKIGLRKIKVTRKLEQRAILARNLKKMSGKK
jgi:hypothetical protein|tara:strand:- start:49 stop:288 length:240 start_codon:yes stop_codon:yes gene_type:complete